MDAKQPPLDCSATFDSLAKRTANASLITHTNRQRGLIFGRPPDFVEATKINRSKGRSLPAIAQNCQRDSAAWQPEEAAKIGWPNSVESNAEMEMAKSRNANKRFFENRSSIGWLSQATAINAIPSVAQLQIPDKLTSDVFDGTKTIEFCQKKQCFSFHL